MAEKRKSGDGDVPLYLKIDDGNADDKSVFVERLKEFKKQWKFEEVSAADSALYTAENIGAMVRMKWITRVPLSLKEAQNKIVEIEEEEWEESKIKGYKIATKSSEYANIKQRWVVVESEARKQAAIKRILEQVEKQLENAKAGLRKLSNQGGVRNQVKKRTDKPTMRWIFQMFQAVHLVRINGEK